MSQLINDDILDEIRERIEIVRVINEYVPLKRAGHSYKGCCPFHKEKTPSFFVNPQLRIFKCFGCGESGNIFSFLMKYEGISFHQAVERLARVAGVLLPEPDPESAKKRSIKQQLYKINTAALRIFQDALVDDLIGRKAKTYLHDRSLTLKEIKRFELGYAPDSWDYLMSSLLKQGFSPAELEATGLVIKNPEKRSTYDRLRNRLKSTFASVFSELSAETPCFD